MKKIVYYISDYGYGHATRSIAVIREIIKFSKSDLKIIVCHSFAIDFLRTSLQSDQLEYREVETDIGYKLNHNSMFPDSYAQEEEYLRFIKDWDLRLQDELNFLKENDVDLVISDISPIPFIPAHKCNIPSIGISNFTWYTAYHSLVRDEYLHVFKKAYEHMNFYYSLSGNFEPLWGAHGKYNFKWLARPSEFNEVQRIIEKVNPSRTKTIVYFGLGMKVSIEDIQSFEIWDNKDCIFLVSSNLNLDLPNVYKIPENYTESQNYICAADVVISKAGWSTVSEAVINNKPLVILDRNNMSEDNNTVKYLRDNNHLMLLSWEEIKSLKIDSKLLNTLQEQKLYNSQNDIYIVARNILETL
ncbi:glycosyltransferase family protein [Halobacillus litoralis]|uniref:glycosyltransferase family protein n=1 Tax=Halobacillus litoralis TaxID=45668 RepID=UPI001CFCE2BE|nr:glycosyltransferase family protein [Halobacillus litoralis]